MDDLRKAANNVYRDLQARNLLIPAGILLLLIVLAVVALPKSPAGAPAASMTAPAHNADTTSQRAAVAAITVSGNETLSGKQLVSFDSIDPFSPKSADAKCYVGKVNGVKAVICMVDGQATVAACEGASCATGGTTTSTGGTTPEGTMPPDDGNGNDEGSDEIGGEPIYVVDVTLDGKTYKNLEAGDGIPTSGAPTMFYAGASTSGKSAQFLVADGISVQGAEFDAELGVFSAQEGDAVVLTDETGKVFQFKLKDISKK